MSDTTAEPITLEAFDPAELLMDANARSDAEATVDKAFVASLKAHAATSPKFPVYGDRTRLAGAATTSRSPSSAARTASCGSAPGTAATSAACAPASASWASSPATRATSGPTGAPG